jgi:hypothetical protein
VKNKKERGRGGPVRGAGWAAWAIWAEREPELVFFSFFSFSNFIFKPILNSNSNQTF